MSIPAKLTGKRRFATADRLPLNSAQTDVAEKRCAPYILEAFRRGSLSVYQICKPQQFSAVCDLVESVFAVRLRRLYHGRALLTDRVLQFFGLFAHLRTAKRRIAFDQRQIQRGSGFVRLRSSAPCICRHAANQRGLFFGKRILVRREQ